MVPNRGVGQAMKRRAEMRLRIRDVKVGDAGSIVAILNPIIEAGSFTTFDTPLTVKAESEYISIFPARGVFLVATLEEEQIVGFQSMEPFAAYTHAFDHVGVLGTYVDLAWRRRGVASRLFKATFAQARTKGYAKIFTFIREDNPAALATYQKHGFRVVGVAEKHARIDGRFIDEVIVEKHL
jgi:L-amino acid N-acyltransferase YncA